MIRQEHAVVALNGEIYIIGGFAPLSTGSVQAYNPSTDTWRNVANFPPGGVHHANAAAVGGTMYVAGFYTGNGFNSADGRVYAYDPAQNRWTAKTSMPAGSQRASGCVAVQGSKIYVFGGARSGTVADSSAYDAATDSWESLPALPQPREHCVAGEIGGKLYILSGRSGSITGFQPTSWAYDPALRRYEQKASIPTPRGGTAGAVLAGKLYVFGGEGSASDPGNVFPKIEAYDPATDSWQALPNMLVPRHGYGAAALEGRIYLPGGATQMAFGAVADHTAFRLP
jgi:N-acetylneuraminic acid mutarotase